MIHWHAGGRDAALLLANVLISLSALREKKKPTTIVACFPHCNAASPHSLLAVTPACSFLFNWYLQTTQRHQIVPTYRRDVISTLCFSNEPSFPPVFICKTEFLPPTPHSPCPCVSSVRQWTCLCRNLAADWSTPRPPSSATTSWRASGTRLVICRLHCVVTIGAREVKTREHVTRLT